MNIAKPMHVEVQQRGDKVALILGNTEMLMSYQEALTLSAWLRMRGGQAKLEAGHTERMITGIGTMEDLEDIVTREQARKFM